MKLSKRGTLAAVAVTGVTSGALAFGGVTLASASAGQSPAAATVAAATPAATPTATPSSGGCAGGAVGPGIGYGRLPGPQVVQAVASYLGLSQADLLSQLRSGKTLAAIAAAHGKSVDGLKNAILTAGTEEIDASTWLTAAQKATLVSDLKSQLDNIVNGTFPAGPPWPGPGGWPGM